LPALDIVTKEKTDGCILRFEGVVLRVGDKVKVCSVVVGDTKGLLKGKAGLKGQPDVGDRGVDEGEDAVAGKEIFGTFLVGELDGLETNDKVAGDVRGEIE